MRKIKYVVKGEQSVTVCPCGMTTFAGEPKMVGTLGCIMCVNHAGQSYTADGGVVSCLGSGYRAERQKRDNKTDGFNGSDGFNGRNKRVTKINESNGADGLNGRVKRTTKRTTKRVSKKVSKNNNTKMKKEEKI